MCSVPGTLTRWILAGFIVLFYPVLTLALLCRTDSVKSSIPSTGNQGTQSYCVHPLAKALHSAMSNEWEGQHAAIPAF